MRPAAVAGAVSEPSLRPVHLDAVVLLLFGLCCSVVGATTFLARDLFDSALLLWGGLVAAAVGLCLHALVRTGRGR